MFSRVFINIHTYEGSLLSISRRYTQEWPFPGVTSLETASLPLIPCGTAHCSDTEAKKDEYSLCGSRAEREEVISLGLFTPCAPGARLFDTGSRQSTLAADRTHQF